MKVLVRVSTYTSPRLIFYMPREVILIFHLFKGQVHLTVSYYNSQYHKPFK